MMVTRVGSKTFIGKNIIHVAVFKKKDLRTVYNMVYKMAIRVMATLKDLQFLELPEIKCTACPHLKNLV